MPATSTDAGRRSDSSCCSPPRNAAATSWAIGVGWTWRPERSNRVWPPANNVTELIAQAKRAGKPPSIGVAGVGSANHLAGQIDLGFANVATVQQLIKAGRLKLIGVSTAKRLPAWPDVPAVAETLAGFDYSSWYGLFGPAGMDRKQAERIAAAEFDQFVRREIERWGDVIAKTGAEVE